MAAKRSVVLAGLIGVLSTLACHVDSGPATAPPPGPEPLVATYSDVGTVNVRNDATGSQPTRRGREGNPVIIAYVAQWCGVCSQARRWLDANGYVYEARDIEENGQNAMAFMNLNPRGTVPTFQVDGRRFVGFDADAFESFVDSAKARRAAMRAR